MLEILSFTIIAFIIAIIILSLFLAITPIIFNLFDWWSDKVEDFFIEIEERKEEKKSKYQEQIDEVMGKEIVDKFFESVGMKDEQTRNNRKFK